MKRLNLFFACVVMFICLFFSGCSYGKETSKILDVTIANYNSVYKLSEEKQVEIALSNNDMRVYYFCKNSNVYSMRSESLVSEFLYMENGQNSFNSNISYTVEDNQIIKDGVAVGKKQLNYSEFKNYCFDSFEDEEDGEVSLMLYGLVQLCLNAVEINNVHSGIFVDNRLCYADIPISLINCNTYLDIIKKRLGMEEYKIFHDNFYTLSKTNQKTVTLGVLTNNNIDAVYPVVTISHRGVDWFKIDMLNYIV